MLKAGEAAPKFEAESTTGNRVSLEALRGKKVVIYFFPKAFTSGCTVETKQFRDNYDELRALGAEVIGISCDDFDTQCRFSSEHHLRFPLIGDRDRKISGAFGVLWPLIKIPQRITFVIDETGIVRAVFHHETQVSKHLDDVRRFLERKL